MKRKGFTLIELVVAMAILFILVYMGFSVFSVSSAIARAQQEREGTLESVTNVLDQITKELRQTVTYTSGHLAFNGIIYPASKKTRDITSVITAASIPNIGKGVPYVFDATKDPILMFYTAEDDGIYRITYTLGVPTGGGIAQKYWMDSNWQPCTIFYSKDKWNDTNGNWTVDNGELVSVINKQAISEQIITNLGVVRPAWSDKVVQIVIKTRVRDASGEATQTTIITRIAQVALRQ